MNRGATAIEYCMIAAGLSIVILAAVNAIGTTLNTNIHLGQLLSEIAADRKPAP